MDVYMDMWIDVDIDMCLLDMCMGMQIIPIDTNSRDPCSRRCCSRRTDAHCVPEACAGRPEGNVLP